VSLSVTIGRVVWRGTLAAVALAAVVVGLVWLNSVAAAVMDVGGSCGSGGPYEIASPCPTGAWMAPVGIFLGLIGVAVYAFVRPSGSPSLVALAWPALFGSLGVQFLRAAAGETDAWGWWLCGVLFLAMAVAPVAFIVADDRRALPRMLLGDGLAEVDPADRARSTAPTTAPGVNVTFVAPSANGTSADGDLAESLERLSKLHRCGDLSDAEYAEAKQKVLDGA
jgi:hypothetical protein